MYIWEGDDGYHIDVAARRYIDDVPELPPLLSDGYWEAYKKQQDWLESARTEEIGGAYDGEHFIFCNVSDAYQWTLELINAGYTVPPYAVEALRENARTE